MKNIQLQYFGVKNFKSFKGEHWFHLKNITFLIGQNSSGKSSLINALRIANHNENQSDISDIGLKENWLNDECPEDNVALSNVAKTNVDHLNNRLYYFNSYYPQKNNHYLHGEVFRKYYGNITQTEIDGKTQEEFEYVIAFHPTENFYIDRFTEKHITESDFNNYYIEVSNLLKKRNLAISNLINYTIKSSIERQKWLEEKERLINENQSTSPTWGGDWESIEQLMNPIPYQLFEFIIDFIVENYDQETENDSFKREKFYTNLISIMKSNSHGLDTKINYAFIEGFQLAPLKSLLLDILKYDFVTPEIIMQYGKFFLNISPNNISYTENKNINLAYLSNKKNDLDYFFLNKIKPEVINNSDFKERLAFVNKYLKLFNIGDELEFEETQVRNKIEIEPYIISKGKRKKLFTHFGFGVQLLIPLLLEVLFNDSDLLLIEEPESNLHPALQSKLADFFAELTNVYNKQLIIETHSEYIIRRMQYLVANHYKKNKTELTTIEAEKVNIYYFNSPEVQSANLEPYTFEIKIDQKGMLDKDFGVGFFDEAANLTLDLLRINSLN